MQSFRQYRSFKATVKRQYERDFQKAEARNAWQEPVSLGGESSENRGQPPTMERMQTENTLRLAPTASMALRPVLTGIEVRQMTREMSNKLEKKNTASGNAEKNGIPKDQAFVVNYESEFDPMSPHNWSYARRISATMLIASIGFIVGFASSVDSAALPQAAKYFGVSEVAESLATGLFLIGFGFGGLFAGPISETIGRNPVYIVTLFIYICWLIGAALAPNLGAQLVFRFLAGFFGATPLTCAGGSISDLWRPLERVIMFPVFANAAFMGPLFGPVVGGFIGQSSLVSWRWTEWITIIFSGLILILVILFQPETYAPVLLKWKAKHLRELTGDLRYVAEVEIKADTFWRRLLTALYRPFLITAKEPIVILFALYLTVVYIILFTFLDGYTYIFGDTYGFSEGITGLAFVGIAVGLCGASILVPFIYASAKKKLVVIKANGGTQLPPEFRLWFAMLGAPALPISLFWMGWTTYPSISYWSPLLASVLFGFGILTIFISTYQYIIDSYELYAASALASLTLIRYVAAGGMVVVGIPFYENLGVHWTCTILGAISAVMVPVPYLFYKFGPRIRAHSGYAQANT